MSDNYCWYIVIFKHPFLSLFEVPLSDLDQYLKKGSSSKSRSGLKINALKICARCISPELIS